MIIKENHSNVLIYIFTKLLYKASLKGYQLSGISKNFGALVGHSFPRDAKKLDLRVIFSATFLSRQ